MEWTKREKIASTVIGSFATVFLVISLSQLVSLDESSGLWHMGMALVGYALAVSPNVLFEKVLLKNKKYQEPKIYGISALLMIIGNSCLIFGAALWLLEKI